MTKQRPLSIVILAVLVGLGALLALYNSIQFLRYLGATINPTQISYYALLGAVNCFLVAAIFAWLVFDLWKLQPGSPLYTAILASVAILMAFIFAYSYSTPADMFPFILLYAVIVMFCLMPGIKEACAPAPEAAPAVVEAEAEPERDGMPVAGAALAVAAVAVAADASADDEEPVEEAPADGNLAEAAAVGAAIAPFVDETEPPVDETLAPVTVAAGAAPARRKIPIEIIEGIGPTYGEKLKAVGVVYVSDLLECGASRKGREDLVKKTGISSAMILKWVNMADLMRVSGIGEEYSELLEAAGVDTVKELRNRKPENLFQAMNEANARRKLVRRTPYLSEVQSWVEQAKQLDPVMTY